MFPVLGSMPLGLVLGLMSVFIFFKRPGRGGVTDRIAPSRAILPALSEGLRDDWERSDFVLCRVCYLMSYLHAPWCHLSSHTNVPPTPGETSNSMCVTFISELVPFLPLSSQGPGGFWFVHLCTPARHPWLLTPEGVATLAQVMPEGGRRVRGREEGSHHHGYYPIDELCVKFWGERNTPKGRVGLSMIFRWFWETLNL